MQLYELYAICVYIKRVLVSDCIDDDDDDDAYVRFGFVFFNETLNAFYTENTFTTKTPPPRIKPIQNKIAKCKNKTHRGKKKAKKKTRSEHTHTQTHSKRMSRVPIKSAAKRYCYISQNIDDGAVQ